MENLKQVCENALKLKSEETKEDELAKMHDEHRHMSTLLGIPIGTMKENKKESFTCLEEVHNKYLIVML